MKAAIAGAGIAGLAAGIALRQAGCEVEIFERSSELREVGAGLMIWPNGTRSLETLGVEVDALTVRRLDMFTWRGRLLNRFSLDAIRERYGFDTFLVHRADLQAALAERFGVDGINLGAEICDFRQVPNGVDVFLCKGTATKVDFLVGADGLRSPIRRRLLHDGDPFYLGSTVWRGIAYGDGFGLPRDGGINWVGRGSEFLAFQLKGGRIYWAGVMKEPVGERPGVSGHKSDLLQRFGKWAQPVAHLITATDDDAILRNDMYDRRAVDRWSDGHVTLVGDAAHPMTPNAGQGACQALEDAVALGASLEQTSNVIEAFKLYEQRRLSRANRLVSISRQATRAVQIENRFMCAVRDGVGSDLMRWLFPRSLDWILAPAQAASG